MALTVTSGSDIGAVATLHVSVTTTAGGSFTFDFTPPLDDGSILRSSFFERITLPSGLSGPATVTVEAQNAAHTTTASGLTKTNIVKNGAVAASVKLMPGGLPVGDGGADVAHDGGGDTGDAPAAGDAPMGDAAGDTGG